MTLEPGLAATFRHTRTEADIAVAVGSGKVPVLGFLAASDCTRFDLFTGRVARQVFSRS
jgi:hypothetical protein